MATAKTQVAKAKNTLPVDFNAQMAAEVEAFKNKVQTHGGDKIKADEKVFTLPNGDSAEELSVIIVDFVSVNSYYDRPWSKGMVNPPACYAISSDAIGLIPSDSSPDKQCESCTACWANQWKSSATGDGKACKNERLMALMAPDDADSPLMVLNVTPTALKNFDSYVASVARSFQRPPRGVITTITFDPNVKHTSLRFSDPAPCTQEQLAAAWARKDEAMARLMQEPDVSAYVKPTATKGKAPVRRAA